MKTPELSTLLADYLLAFWEKDKLEEYSSVMLYKVTKENHYIFSGFCLHYGIGLKEFNDLTKEDFSKESFWEEVDNIVMEYLTEPVVH